MNPPGIDDWKEPFPDNPILHRLPAPVPVLVDTPHVFPASWGFARADRLPLRVRAGGIRLEASMAAYLHAWLRLSAGSWIAQVCASVSSANGHSHADLWLWVDSAAVRPR